MRNHALLLWYTVALILSLEYATVWATTYAVGTTRAYRSVGSLPVLKPGDMVEIDAGTYSEVKRWAHAGTSAQPIVIRGVGPSRPIFNATDQNVDGVMPHPRAVFQVEADYLTLENLEFKNARNGNNGAGLRITSANHIIVRNCKITACDMGVMSDHNDDLLIEACEIAANGTPLHDGYSHNLYLGGIRSTIRYCYIHDALYGQNFKSRCHYTELLYNYIADSQDGEIGLVDDNETATSNSHAVMIGNIVVSKPRQQGYNSGRFIQFGQDLGGLHDGALFAFNNTFIAGDRRIQFLNANANGSQILACNNIFDGSDQIAGTLVGGIRGSNNWVMAAAANPITFSESIMGSDPGFVNRLTGNFHLTANSPCRNMGVNALAYRDGAGVSHTGLPTLEYVNHLQNHPRLQDSQIDVGAYECTAPRLRSIQFHGQDCVIGLHATAGNQYGLQWTSNPATGLWSLVTNYTSIMDGMIQLIDPNAAHAPQRFYRVKVSQ